VSLEKSAIVSNLFILDHDQSPTPIIATAAISNLLFRHWTFLLLFPLYDRNPINLHLLMVLSVGGIANAVLIPELVIFEIHSQPHDFKW
jgi:hypothetical protein